MLILTRKKDESIVINEEITIQIISIEEGKVKIGIDAPKNVSIFRSEIVEKVQASNIEALASKTLIGNLSDKIKK